MLEVLQRITAGNGSMEDLEMLRKLARNMKEASLCALGQLTPSPSMAALRFFEDEFVAHVIDKRCPAGVCAELKRYRIIAEACKGCQLCAKKCPTNAILGSPKHPHVIVAEKCIGCGTCLDVCRLGAVVTE